MSGVKWVGSGAAIGAQKVWQNPQFRGSTSGCAANVIGGLAMAGAVAAGTGGQVEISGIMLAFDCLTGATSGYWNSIKAGSGGPIEMLDTSVDVYDIYRMHLR